VISETADAVATTWPAWRPQEAAKALLMAGLSSLFATPTSLPAGQIRTWSPA
jgi:hypothetical protein